MNVAVTAPDRSTPTELEDRDDDLEGPPSAVYPRLPLGAVPSLAITVEGLRFLPLDSRAAYLLSLVDGQCNVETILDVCDMGRDETLAMLVNLLQLGAIELREP